MNDKQELTKLLKEAHAFFREKYGEGEVLVSMEGGAFKPRISIDDDGICLYVGLWDNLHLMFKDEDSEDDEDTLLCSLSVEGNLMTSAELVSKVKKAIEELKEKGELNNGE